MIAIIKYNAGNVKSVQNALNRLGVESTVTDDADLLLTAEKIIFPGVGEAKSAMEYLRQKKLDETILTLNQPFLGICLGLQLMCQSSEEGNTACLGIFEEKVVKFSDQYKVPHMGWNNLTDCSSPILSKLPKNNDVYFVHSYYAETGDHTIATTDYGVVFSAALHKDNFYGVQFHPEKSAYDGEQILRNFLAL